MKMKTTQEYKSHDTKHAIEGKEWDGEPIKITGHAKEAVFYFEKAINIANNKGEFYTQAKWGLADLLWRHRHTAESLKILREIVEKVNNRHDKYFKAACNHLAEWHGSHGEPEKAIEYYNKFLD